MRTIAIVNQKGGCGKTTTAINLAGVFSHLGRRTLLIDLDPQSHCASGLAIPEGRVELQIGDALLAGPDKPIDWTRLLWRVGRNLDLAPSSVRLAGLESARGGLASVPNAERRLADVLARVADQYDLCLLDCPPSIGMLTYNALVAASEVLIPVETGFFALQGATKQVSAVQSLAKRLAASPAYRLLATIHNTESTLARDVLAELGRRFQNGVIPVVVREDAKLREAVSFGQPVIDYAPESHGAQDYLALGRWLLDNPPERASRRVKPSIRQPDGGEPGHVQVRPEAAESVLGAGGRHAHAGEPGVHAAARARATNLLDAPAGQPAPAASPPAPPAAAAPPASRATEMAARVQRIVARGEDGAPLPRVSMEQLLRSIGAVMGVRATSQGLLFVQPMSLGERVCIAGDFNGWSDSATPMERNASLGLYEKLVALPPGDVQYRLVVDGRWMPDPHNDRTADNPFGGVNSVATAQEVPGQAPAMALA